VAGDFERLAYEASLRSLEKQESLLDELRARTNTLLAVSSLTASVLGREAFSGAGSQTLTITALAAFVISVAAGVFVLLPKWKLAFAESGAGMYEGLYELHGDMPEVYRSLIYELDCHWTSNDAQIALLARAYTIAAIASVFELLSLAALIGSNVL
jgi:hypothetical protein